jgi:hypothetical protein
MKKHTKNNNKKKFKAAGGKKKKNEKTYKNNNKKKFKAETKRRGDSVPLSCGLRNGTLSGGMPRAIYCCCCSLLSCVH